jgi:PAS domain S-box-containing protein
MAKSNSSRKPSTGRKNELLRALNTAAASLQRSAHSEDDVFEAFCAQIRGVGLVGIITLLDEDEKTLILRAIAQPSRLISRLERLTGLTARGFRFPLAEVEVHRVVIETGKPIFINGHDLIFERSIPVLARPFTELILKTFGGAAWIVAPLISDGRSRGVVGISADDLTTQDIDSVEAFANHVAVALHNARLFAALQRTEARYRRLFESATDGIIIIDPDTRSILEANKRALEMCGFSQAEVDNLPIDTLITPDLLEESRQFFHNLRQQGEATFEFPMHRPDGTPWLMHCATSLFEANGRTLVQGVIHDITGRKQEDEALRRRAEELTRLHEAERSEREQAETLRDVSRVMSSSLDRNEIIPLILGQIKRVLKFDTASVLLSGDEGKTALVAGVGYDNERMTSQAAGDLLKKSAILAQMSRDLQPVTIPDVRSHPDWIWVPGAEHVRSFLAVPIISRGKMIGALMADSIHTGAYGKEQAHMAQALAQHIAIAFENASLFEQVTTERRRLSLLYSVSRELASTLDVDDILYRAIALTCQALDGSIGYAFLYVPKDNRLSLRAQYGIEESSITILDEQIGLAPGEGLAGWVAEHRQPINLPDVTQDPRWVNVPGVKDEVHSAIIAPILSGERLLGILTVLHQEVKAFSEDHLAVMQGTCQQVALALSSADRYQQIQSLVDRLADEQHNLEILIERLPSGVIVLDADYCLQAANPLGRKVLLALGGCETGQALLYFGSISLGDLTARHAQSLPVEIAIEGPPRLLLEVEVRSIGGISSQWVLTLRDITAERENLARTQMQERLATVGQLAAGIAHDFNNIMAAILVYADLLTADTGLPQVSRERLHIIQQQVQRAASLIRQILDFSRRSVMEQSTLDLLPFIKELDKLLARVLPENIQLELDYQNETYLVNADPTRLQQAFMNLALNARDAMPQGGCLNFKLGRLQIKADEPSPAPELPAGDWVHIVVADTGQGIPPDILPHIWEPFFTTKPVGQGTGLGLSQVYGIIKQHGGAIDVASQVGEGARFNIYLPALAAPGEEGMGADAPARFDGTGKTVLVVEDDQVTREAIQSLLKVYNFWVLTAPNGFEAIKIYKQMGKVITMVVTDLVMPEMGGVALYHALHEQHPDVKVLIITGHPLEEDSQALLEKGNVHWVQKPFSAKEFGQAMQALLVEG